MPAVSASGSAEQSAVDARLPPLLVVAPIEPRTTGNGLSMRVANLCVAAGSCYDVHVAVIPVAGRVRDAGRVAGLRVTVLHASSAAANPAARDAGRAGVTLADLLGPRPGTPVLAVRSYLAPTAIALAETIGSAWVAVDLDDDDEAFLESSGDVGGAANVRRLMKAVVPRVSAFSAASPREAAEMSRRHGIEVVTVANTVTVPAYRPPYQDGRSTVLFVGNLTYEPNVDAATRLALEVMPDLRREAGRKVEAVIVGPYNPAGPLGGLEACDAVTLTGFVDDLGVQYRRAGVVVAPIALAGGTRIKLLEAFAAGVPVVTTPAGAAGLDVTHGEHLLVGESPGDLARLAARVLERRPLGEGLAANAFELVSRRYSPAAARTQMAELIARAEANGRPAGTGRPARGRPAR